MKPLIFTFLLLVTIAFAGCQGSGSGMQQDSASLSAATPSGELTAAEARGIARDAYIYGYPMLDDYRIRYAYFVDRDNTEYKGIYNVLYATARVYTPADKAVQTPNSDTPYGMVAFDLRTEPFVITVPKIEKGRYYSIQLIDAYTHNFAYIGSRETGNVAGNYLLAGPNWKGEVPKGVDKIIPCETETALGVYRTQLYNPKDLPNVKAIQAGYKITPLSAYLKQPAPTAAAPIEWKKPLTSQELKTSLEFFNLLNFDLGFCPTHPSETELMKRFAKINVGAGKTFDSTAFSPEILEAIRQGRADAWAAYAGIKARADKKEITSGDMFGTREFLKNNYAYRMAAAIVGIYGNSKAEAMYPIYSLDDKGAPLIGTNNYSVTFPADKFPPANAFWSLTMYEMPSSLLVENPLNRYLINSPMLPQLKKNKDGSLTLYVGNASPGKDKESNWLPAPKGPFICVMRLYWPKEEAVSGAWTQPPLVRNQ